jgi:protein phosphatase
MFIYRHAGLSDRGIVRPTNEDRWTADPNLGLYLVVDGMGGHVAGGVAADIVAKTLPIQIKNQVVNASHVAVEEAGKRVQAVLCELNDALVKQTRGEFGLEGLGATFVMLLVWHDVGLIAHLGDSRAYLRRAGQLSLITSDHTVLQLLLDRGEVADSEARDHPARHQLTRYVGMLDSIPPDLHTISFQCGDSILLCSDGLSGSVTDHRLSELIGTARDPGEACRRLVAEATSSGCYDNMTALLVEVLPSTVASVG